MNASFRMLPWISASRVLSATLAGVATILLTIAPAYASAAEAGQTLQTSVRYSDLDLASSEGAATLYQRIITAAHRVCPADVSRDLRLARAVRECREQAIARAVEAVGSPQLAAVHVARDSKG